MYKYILLSEAVIAILSIVIAWFIFSKCYQKRKQKKVITICTNELCRELDTLMRLYISRVLSGSDKSQELKNVVNHLQQVYNEIHNNDRKEMFQCLRTTLISHPNDTRGRRRAANAKEIVEEFILKDTSCAVPKKGIKKLQELLSYCFGGHLFGTILPLWHCTRGFLVYFYDIYTDLVLMYYLSIALLKINKLMRNIDNLSSNLSPQNLTAISNNQTLSKSFVLNRTWSSILHSCNYTNLRAAKTDLTLLDSFLTSYVFNLMVPFLLSISIQTIRGRFQFGRFNILSTIAGSFWNLFLTSNIMGNPKREIERTDCAKCLSGNDCDNKVHMIQRIKYKNRFAIIVSESLYESFNTTSVLWSFYFTFTYIAGNDNPRLKCLSVKSLSENQHLFTYRKLSWTGIPIMVQSTIAAVLSIVAAQISIYKTKHEFDMSFLGTLTYFFAVLLAATSSLTIDIFFRTIYLIMSKHVLFQENVVVVFITISLPQIILSFLQLSMRYFIHIFPRYPLRKNGNITMPKVGYPLDDYIMNIFPASSITRPPQSLSFLKGLKFEKFCKRKSKLLLALCSPIFGMFPGWFLWPNAFGFNNTYVSRQLYQKRFFMSTWFKALRHTIILSVACIFYFAYAIDFSKQIATQNFLYTVLIAIPVYASSLALFRVFYKYCHIWVREGIQLGYSYTDCCWVNHGQEPDKKPEVLVLTDDDRQSNEDQNLVTTDLEDQPLTENEEGTRTQLDDQRLNEDIVIPECSKLCRTLNNEQLDYQGHKNMLLGDEVIDLQFPGFSLVSNSSDNDDMIRYDAIIEQPSNFTVTIEVTSNEGPLKTHKVKFNRCQNNITHDQNTVTMSVHTPDSKKKSFFKSSVQNKNEHFCFFGCNYGQESCQCGCGYERFITIVSILFRLISYIIFFACFFVIIACTFKTIFWKCYFYIFK